MREAVQTGLLERVTGVLVIGHVPVRGSRYGIFRDTVAAVECSREWEEKEVLQVDGTLELQLSSSL